MSGRLHLRAPSGLVINYTLPLHETIQGQWRAGELQRVTEDGGPYPGDQFDVSDVLADDAGDVEPDGGDAGSGAGNDPGSGSGGDGAPDPDAGQPDSAAAEPPRPAASAPKQAWQEYAVALGAASEEDASGMTKDALVKLCTPPEIDPLVPKE